MSQNSEDLQGFNTKPPPNIAEILMDFTARIDDEEPNHPPSIEFFMINGQIEKYFAGDKEAQEKAKAIISIAMPLSARMKALRELVANRAKKMSIQEFRESLLNTLKDM